MRNGKLFQKNYYGGSQSRLGQVKISVGDVFFKKQLLQQLHQ